MREHNSTWKLCIGIGLRNKLNDNYQDSMCARVTYLVGITTSMATNVNIERMQANM